MDKDQAYQWHAEFLKKIQNNPTEAWLEMVEALEKQNPEEDPEKLKVVVTALIQQTLKDPNWEPKEN